MSSDSESSFRDALPLTTTNGDNDSPLPLTSSASQLPSQVKVSWNGITTEKRVQCPKCFKFVFGASNLLTHMRTHTGEKPFRCDICHKNFSQRGNLIMHKRLHTGEKPFKCPDCGRRFTQKGNLKAHMRCHTGETPYGCPFCSAKFSQHSGLKSHLRNHSEQLQQLGLPVDGSQLPPSLITYGAELHKELQRQQSLYGHHLPGMLPQNNLDDEEEEMDENEDNQQSNDDNSNLIEKSLSIIIETSDDEGRGNHDEDMPKPENLCSADLAAQVEDKLKEDDVSSGGDSGTVQPASCGSSPSRDLPKDLHHPMPPSHSPLPGIRAPSISPQLSEKPSITIGPQSIPPPSRHPPMPELQAQLRAQPQPLRPATMITRPRRIHPFGIDPPSSTKLNQTADSTSRNGPDEMEFKPAFLPEDVDIKPFDYRHSVHPFHHSSDISAETFRASLMLARSMINAYGASRAGDLKELAIHEEWLSVWHHTTPHLRRRVLNRIIELSYIVTK